MSSESIWSCAHHSGRSKRPVCRCCRSPTLIGSRQRSSTSHLPRASRRFLFRQGWASALPCQIPTGRLLLLLPIRSHQPKPQRAMASTSQDKCPVDHAAIAQQNKCPVDHGDTHGASSEKCPVDNSTRSSWTSWFSSKPESNATSSASTTSAHPQISGNAQLPIERETSSIPRLDGSNWVYPSQAQFYSAMERKNHNPHATDMKVIVPIHNAVNERAWAEVMKWEAGQGGDKCGGVKLVSFKGRPKDLTPKARWKVLLGYVAPANIRMMGFEFITRYSRPFDRHDWVVDRCGTRMRYIIDFYTGHGQGPSANNLSFYLDVRPALDDWEGVRLRAERFWEQWIGASTQSTSSPPPTKPATAS